jgi:hypothetical protein
MRSSRCWVAVAEPVAGGRARYGRRARCGCQARCGVAEPVTVLDALEHVLSRARCARPLSSSPRLDEDDDIGVNPYNAF